MIEAASDSGATQVVAPNDGSVIDALRRGDEGATLRQNEHCVAAEQILEKLPTDA
jgi:hypothetical protein